MDAALQPAHVLHTRPYRDSSLLVELLTDARGRVSAVARGARRSSRRKPATATQLQPFAPLLVQLRGRSELLNLTGVERAAAVAPLAGRALFSGLYLNELTLRLLHRDDPHAQMYDNYVDALCGLRDGRDLDLVLRRYEFSLLSALGYGFDLRSTGREQQPVRSQDFYRFDSEFGLEHEPRGGNGSYSGADLLAIAAGEFTDTARHTARALMREALEPHLAGKPLHSRSLFPARQAQ